MKNFIMVEKDLLTKGLKGNSLKLFMMMLDRAKLSERNGWIDKDNGEVYIIMTVKEICEKLGVCKRTAASTLNNLEAAHLICRKKQGLGKPQRIFVYQAAQCDSNISQYSNDVNKFEDNSVIFQENTSYQDNHAAKLQTGPASDCEMFMHEFYVDWWEQYAVQAAEPENQNQDEDVVSLQEKLHDAAMSRILKMEIQSNNTSGNEICVPETPEQDADTEQAMFFSATSRYAADSRGSVRSKRSKNLHPKKCKKLHSSNINYNNTKSVSNNITNLSYPIHDDENSYITIRDTFLNNIEYRTIAGTAASAETLCALADMVAETLAETKKQLYVAGVKRNYADVYSRLMSVDSSHIEYIFECLNGITAPVRNPKAYMLACLYNAPATMGAYYELQARIDINRQMAGII